jgi:biotin-(acetyl-CoA carboxylase) ligase
VEGGGRGGCSSLTISREVLLATVLNTLEEYLDQFEQEGFAPFAASYLATWFVHAFSLFVSSLQL